MNKIADEKAASTARLQILANFRHHLRLFLQFSESSAAHYGIEPQHHQLLLQVAGAEDGIVTTVGYVATRLGLRANSVGQLCKRMEEKGWITRTPSEVDRRSIVLGLTLKGSKILESLALDHARELKDLAPQLIKTLSKISTSYSNANSIPISRVYEK